MTPQPLVTVTLNGEPVPVDLVTPLPLDPEALTPVLESSAHPLPEAPPEAPWQPGEVCRVSLTVSVRTTRHGG